MLINVDQINHDVVMAEPDDRRLTANEAAARLGVKRETLYAYVSRGQLPRQRTADGRRSTFSAAHVERLARDRGRPGASRPGELDVGLRTSITRAGGGAVAYRGHDVADLAGTWPYESVARLLWTGELAPAATWVAPPVGLEAARTAVATLPDRAPPGDQLRLAVAAAAPHDPLRHDLRPEAVASTAERMVATAVDALPEWRAPGPGGGPTLAQPDGALLVDPIAGRLWRRLTDRPPEPALVQVLDAALVLLADHDLAASTFAVRVATTVRADPWAAVGAGLGALAGRLHGGASAPVQLLLERVAGGADPAVEVAGVLATAGSVPGFGHWLHPDGDPRATILLDRLRAAVGDEALAPTDALVALVGERAPVAPNVDLALAALAAVAGFRPAAGEAVFAVGRMAGWVAHALEELDEPPLRLRPRGLHVGGVA
jgi:citrate synthase